MIMEITYEDFKRVQIHIGTVLSLKKNRSITENQFYTIYPFFKDDIERLEKLLGLNLSHWKQYE